MDRRILFAEFVGWHYEFLPHYGNPQDGEGLLGYRCVWISPTGQKHEPGFYSPDKKVRVLPPFDAENNDTDCMALVRALEDHGWDFVITGMENASHGQWPRCVQLDCGSKTVTWHGDDYKQGVCDLAEPIVREAMKDD